MKLERIELVHIAPIVAGAGGFKDTRRIIDHHPESGLSDYDLELGECRGVPGVWFTVRATGRKSFVPMTNVACVWPSSAEHTAKVRAWHASKAPQVPSAPETVPATPQARGGK